MRAIETARRPAASQRVSLPRPVSWAALALILGGLAVADLVRPPPDDPGPLLDAVVVVLRHDGLRLGSAALLTVGAVWAARRSYFAVLARRPGAIEILPFTGTADGPCPVEEITSDFRRALSEFSLSAPMPMPGESTAQSFLQVFRAAGQAATPLAAVAGMLESLQVSAAYRVSAVLQASSEAPRYGITVHVESLPAGPGETATVWAASWKQATREAAHVVGAFVLPRTRLCRRGPWAEWRGRRIRPELFRAYQQAQACERRHGFEEALGHYYEALEFDPLNTSIRLQVCQLQEKLGLYLVALTGYADLIVTESWKVDPRLWRRLVHDFYEKQTRPERRARRRRRRGRQGRQSSRELLLVARYRFICALVNGDRVLDQWREEPNVMNEVRTKERAGCRRRMDPWLRVYHARFRADCAADLAAPGGSGRPGIDDAFDSEDVEALGPLLRYIASEEARRLAKDYTWYRLRRRPGMPLTQTSLKVLRTWAPLHLFLVAGRGQRPTTKVFDRLWKRIGRQWPPTNIDAVDAAVRGTLRWKPVFAREWQDNYNAAATFAVLLLRHPIHPRPRSTHVDAIAGRAVKYLELAVNSTARASVAEYEQWLAAGDQDLNGLRGTAQYVDFLERYFPAAGRRDARPYDLLTFLASTHLVSLMRNFAGLQANLLDIGDADGGASWGVDRSAVGLMRDYTADHWDWRTRLPLIVEASRLAAEHPSAGAFDPAFPEFGVDPRLASRASGPRHGPPGPGGRRAAPTRAEVDRYYEDLVERRHASWRPVHEQFTRLAARMDDLSRTTAWPGPRPSPADHLVAARRMWRSLESLSDASLRNDVRLPALRHELGSAVRSRIDLLDRTAGPGSPSRGPRSAGPVRAGSVRANLPRPRRHPTVAAPTRPSPDAPAD